MTICDPIFTGGGRARPLTIVRAPRIRTMRLSVDPRDASVRLTLPPRSSLKQAVSWAVGKRGWIERELGKLPAPQPIHPGMRFTLSGEAVTVHWMPDAPRTVRRTGDVLTIGGPEDAFAARLLRYLRREALAILTTETRALAASRGIMVGRIGVGDPKSRWGSCAVNGDIRYSWRLILAPADVRGATVAHEVAHRIHMNHGAAFHALAAELFECDPSAARGWLRAHGAALHWFGRDG